MNTEDRIALHRRMAESYRDKYAAQAVQEGESYEEWKFADNAEYTSPYFNCGEIFPIGQLSKDTSVDVAGLSTMEAKAYSVNFPDWGPVEFKYWASENGFAMKTLFVGHAKDGTRMSFYSIGFVETNDKGEITRWETHVNGEEFGPFLERAIGVRGPFKGPMPYFEALARHLKASGLM